MPRLMALFAVLLATCLCLRGLPALADDADLTSAKSIADATFAAAKAPGPKAGKKWSKGKRIAFAVVASGLIATAIAVPVTVEVHEHHELLQRHHLARYKDALAILATKRENQDIRQEQQLKNMLTTSNLNPAQQVSAQNQIKALDAEVKSLQTEVMVLEEARGVFPTAAVPLPMFGYNIPPADAPTTSTTFTSVAKQGGFTALSPNANGGFQ